MPYFFYMLRCADNALYCGVTTDLERRVSEHNSDPKKGAKSLRGRKPVILIYSEEYASIASALKREHEVKKWSKEKKEKLVQLVV